MKLPLNLLREEMDTQKSQLMQLSENMQTVQESITCHAIAIDEVRLRQDVIDVKPQMGSSFGRSPMCEGDTEMLWDERQLVSIALHFTPVPTAIGCASVPTSMGTELAKGRMFRCSSS